MDIESFSGFGDVTDIVIAAKSVTSFQLVVTSNASPLILDT
jgi:hypothetical protein